MSKFSYEAGITALLPSVSACVSLTCYQRRVTLLKTHVDFHSFLPPMFPLEMTPQGIFVSDGEKDPLICQVCYKIYGILLKEVRQNFWMSLPEISDMDDWDELRRTTAV